MTKKEPDTNPRELIGKVTLLSGEQLEIRMPIMADLINPNVTNRLPFEVMIESSTGMPISEFKKLSVVDGTAILLMLGRAIESVNQYINSNQPDIKKH